MISRTTFLSSSLLITTSNWCKSKTPTQQLNGLLSPICGDLVCTLPISSKCHYLRRKMVGFLDSTNPNFLDMIDIICLQICQDFILSVGLYHGVIKELLLRNGGIPLFIHEVNQLCDFRGLWISQSQFFVWHGKSCIFPATDVSTIVHSSVAQDRP